MFTFQKWIDHQCTSKGCTEGYASIDGNEKLKRPMCATPKDNVKRGKGMPSTVHCCPMSPLRGNQSQKPRTYCQEH